MNLCQGAQIKESVWVQIKESALLLIQTLTSVLDLIKLGYKTGTLIWK